MTPKEEKKEEKETQKREAAENSSDSTSSDEKTLLKKAKKLAQQFDYTGAISVLKNNWKFAHGSVIIDHSHIMRTHQYVTLIIHDLEHFFEFADCGHHMIISGLIGISVKGQ